MEIQEKQVDMELSKALDELIDDYLPALKKSKSDAELEKAKDDEKEEKEEKKDDEKEEKMEKEYKSLSIEEIVDAVKKSLAEDKAKAEDLAKSQQAAEAAKATSEVKDDNKFQKSVVKALSDLQDQMQKIAKTPARVRKSVIAGYEAVEKSAPAKSEPEIAVHEVNSVMLEMVEKSQLPSEAVCEFNTTGNISDPLIKSKVIAAVKAKKGLR